MRINSQSCTSNCVWYGIFKHHSSTRWPKWKTIKSRASWQIWTPPSKTGTLANAQLLSKSNHPSQQIANNFLYLTICTNPGPTLTGRRRRKGLRPKSALSLNLSLRVKQGEAWPPPPSAWPPSPLWASSPSSSTMSRPWTKPWTRFLRQPEASILIYSSMVFVILYRLDVCTNVCDPCV